MNLFEDSIDDKDYKIIVIPDRAEVADHIYDFEEYLKRHQTGNCAKIQFDTQSDLYNPHIKFRVSNGIIDMIIMSRANYLKLSEENKYSDYTVLSPIRTKGDTLEQICYFVNYTADWVYTAEKRRVSYWNEYTEHKDRK